MTVDFLWLAKCSITAAILIVVASALVASAGLAIDGAVRRDHEAAMVSLMILVLTLVFGGGLGMGLLAAVWGQVK